MRRHCLRCSATIGARRDVLRVVADQALDYSSDLIEAPEGNELRDQLVATLLRWATFELLGICNRCADRTQQVAA